MSSRPPATILIVDDHPMFRLGVRHLLQPNDDLELLEASSQQEANVILRENSVDLAIVDISLPDGSGLELIHHQRLQQTRTVWLVLSAYCETFHQMRARRLGASGFLSKRAAQTELVQAVAALLNGRDFPAGFRNNVSAETDNAIELSALSEREMTVFWLISEGNSVEQIATGLSRSKKTINAIRDRIRAKLNIDSSAKLARFAAQWHWWQARLGDPPMLRENGRRPQTANSGSSSNFGVSPPNRFE